MAIGDGNVLRECIKAPVVHRRTMRRRMYDAADLLVTLLLLIAVVGVVGSAAYLIAGGLAELMRALR
jgi:uncharacterized membrane protein